MSCRIKKDKENARFINRLGKLFIVLVSLLLSGSSLFDMKGDGWVIVIDPGHGGKDPGAVGSFSYEKDITLAIALKTGTYLEQNIKGVKVIYTRKNDSDVDLWERAEIANKNKADLFISIHANRTSTKKVYGTETWVMGHNKDQQNLEVAMKENEVILLEKDYSKKYEGFDPKSPESYIIFSLTQNIYLKQSTELASKIQTRYKDNIGRFDRGVKQAGFVVLYMTTMPSVLTETGFISNISEEKYINSKQGQENIALSIYIACRDYINEIDKKSEISIAPEDKSKVTTEMSTSISESKGKILYMVQIATATARVEIISDNFKGITDVIELNSGGYYRYATGKFSEYEKAARYRKQIENNYPDAFVIAVKDNKILPLQEAIDQNKGK